MDHLRVASLWTDALMHSFEAQGISLHELVADIPAVSKDQPIAGQTLDISSARLAWHKAYELTKDDLLGYKIAAGLNFRSAGVLMPICWHSPTPKKALEHIFSFQMLLSNNGVYREKKDSTEQLFHFEYIPTANAIPASDHQILSVLTSTYGLLWIISDYKILPEIMYIPDTLNREVIEEALGYPVKSHKGNFTIVYSSEALQAPITGRDENLYQLTLSYAEGLIREKQNGQTLIDKVTDIIATEKPASYSIDRVADELMMNRRILQRNLADQGTNFREIRENLLRTKALELLISQNRAPTDIAKKLGYSDVSAFHRSFKSWFNTTPKQFKDKHID